MVAMTGRKIAPVLLTIAVVALSLRVPVFSARAQGGTQVQALILMVDDDALLLDQVQAFIEVSGGRSLHRFPHQAIIAKVPPDAVQPLAALPGVAAVFTQAIDLSTIGDYGPDARYFASVWNSLVVPQTPLDVDLMAVEYPDEHNDAFTAPDLPSADEAILAVSASTTPGYYQTSEYMAGSVAVGIVLVESDGSVDPSTEDWTLDERQQVFNEIVAAFDWWAGLEPRAKLYFVYDDHFSNPLPTGVEPITRPYGDQKHWIADAMGALGYDAPCYFTRVRDYANDLRATYQTDWAFTIFVVDSSSDGDNRFSDGYFAYAYLGGPFMVTTYGNNGYGPGNMDAVAAHEIGHIFHALDQYSSANQSCTSHSGYLDVENQNSQYGSCASDVNSIMRGGIYPYIAGAIDPYAAGQIGWRDSDGDGILDPLDTDLPVSIDAISLDGTTVAVGGTAEIIPYPSPSRTSVTINSLAGVQYRFDRGDWQPAAADDGAFDGTAEGYHFAASLPPGLHTLEVAALDSADNVSDGYATETVAILDPVDGGLNTELYRPNGDVSASVTWAMSGVAYHLQGGVVIGVQYRVDTGPWQPASAQDGAFDGDYEQFSLLLDSLAAGMHLIEARAADADGNVEVNFAAQEFTVVGEYIVFLPLVARGQP